MCVPVVIVFLFSVFSLVNSKFLAVHISSCFAAWSLLICSFLLISIIRFCSHGFRYTCILPL